MKIYTLKISVKDLPECYRIVKMSDTSTVAKIAYVILASFNTAMYHLYNIKYKNKVYDSSVEPIENIDGKCILCN